MTVSKKMIEKQLLQVMDPELNMSIIDLGLIYDIKVTGEKKVKITMTLTSLGCPLYSVIEEEIKSHINTLGVNEKDIEITLTFDPPWTMERMSENAKAMLGI
ncbi:hypothetical protein A3F03_00160 [Candidatus Roizmanbacteria bacterium RIFCSPHIGHO2_12_FULL_41_11]|uniref:MIP18 family-like domain-containing protein n=3 Tax=Candidatus Roizmaniibacteriota TaxID=1752723 RepID=A0A1F7JRN2_9BACT|nr:MAG: hypothetical protein A3F03_00160 [Candidatus Roizmanbacteria bacterium RIFCSPHIGHO2_12_FULL_41_11]OGK52381.1 MAG: hypothetical protein A2966_01795 [Candidatus Roizmanbacteria bacterium RIFCSPLOWO2_01_FULL_41_22]OGK58280.1 MAG: hypothetical protein A3H86_01440 [Candidatus Roizmanbacteria bacterium RIFCSPLOWO2_02_FULL_41_9]